jgi:sugar lactone lactonase YvrE
MKRNHPVLHFLFVFFASALLTGCEKTTGIATQNAQDIGESAKMVIVSTFAGSRKDFADGVGSAAKFDLPVGIASDAAGNLYVADKENHRIRKITPAGEVSTIAGGEYGFADGVGSAARFYRPTGIASDATGHLYVADSKNHRIRKITPAGEVSTLAGGERGFADGIGSDAKFDEPSGIASDAAGNLYVADTGNNRIRKITPAGEVSTFAGGEGGFAGSVSAPGFSDGIGSNAGFYRPSDIAIDSTGHLYVVDAFSGRIRKITPAGEVSTFAGGVESDAELGFPSGIAIDAAGHLYVTDIVNSSIRKITPAGEVSTFAGGEEGFADGIGINARFDEPSGIAIDAAGNLYVADSNNNRIRKITPAGEVSTFAGGEEGFADGIGSDTRFYFPNGVAIDTAGNLYVADSRKCRIRKITLAGGVSTLAGGGRGFADGIGSDAKFYAPSDIAIDAAGHLYVTDIVNNRIRKITPAGEVSTFAGSEKGFADGAGSDARFDDPKGITIDAAGNLYVADSGNHRIRKITPAGKVSTLAGGEEGFADGIGSDAKFDDPEGITIDAAGNLYVADTFNYRVRKVTPAGNVSTLAGGEEGFADGIGDAAKFDIPTGIAIDAAGNLYVADRGNHRVRKITPAGEVSTFAGGEEGFADGIGSDAKFDSPSGIAIDAVGHLYVTDSGNRRIRKIEIRRP